MSGWHTTVFAIADHVSGTRFTARRLDGPHYLVPKAEGDALLALLAKGEEWRRRQPSPMPSLHPDAWLASAVVAAHRAVNPPPPAPPEPVRSTPCDKCGEPVPHTEPRFHSPVPKGNVC